MRDSLSNLIFEVVEGRPDRMMFVNCCLKEGVGKGLLEFVFLSSRAVPFRHNEPEGPACVGAVPEDGHVLGLLQSSAAHR